MRPVRVKKDMLLVTLRQNRDAHHGIFAEALEGYRAKALEVFNAEVDKIKAGKPFRSQVYLTLPVDHTADYDAAIGMLELSEDDVVELDEQGYRQLVKDEWEWKHQFLASNSAYSMTASRLAESEEE